MTAVFVVVGLVVIGVHRLHFGLIIEVEVILAVIIIASFTSTPILI